jgi:fimbrial isopeptide formation D2 family protein/LPXTG-motif cell wall-anchored protein
MKRRMIMKTTKRFIAMAAALALTTCAAMPMAMMTANAESVKITNDSGVSHTYEIYQVMTGTVSGNQITAAKWGADVTAYNNNNVTTGDDVSNADLGAISALADAGVLPGKLTLKTANRAYADKSGTGDVTFTGLAPGYYIVKDVTNLSSDEANSAWIVQVAGDATIAIKNAKPTFDKQVQDNDAGETGAVDGYGDSADHAIGESFNFKLNATIPVDADFKEYETYTLKFNDTLSEGITFGSITSVKVDGKTLETTDYNFNNTNINANGGGSFTLTIPDVISELTNKADFGSKAINVEVIYSAALNEKAIVDAASRSGCVRADSNSNTAFLNYSNNPDNTGAGGTEPKGTTPSDDVFVFTYEVDNTKYMINNTAGNELAGATFQLQTADGTPIPLKLDGGAYRPLKSGESGGGNMVSSDVAATLGQFNIKGLDAGTYKLHEVSAPQGYNEATDVTFTIGATHNDANNIAELTLTGAGAGIENKIVDTKNSNLPTTGGMGTTLFILGGGCAAGLAGIYLVSKKRAKEDAE